MRSHVLEEVDEELRRRAPDRLPPGARLLLDLARAGKCGEHSPDEGLARVAQATGEHNEDRASSDAFLDLAYALRNLSPAHESNELCARALAEAWRAEYPFRRGREGAPLDVLLPHPGSDARAALALDRARALPRPPVGLMRLNDELEAFWEGETPTQPQKPFDSTLALALIAEVEQRLYDLPPHHDVEVRNAVPKVRDLLHAARVWVLRRPREHVNELDLRTSLPSLAAASALLVSEEQSPAGVSELTRQYALLDGDIGMVMYYVSSYNTVLRRLTDMRYDLRAVQRLPVTAKRTERIRMREAEIRRIEALFPGEDV